MYANSETRDCDLVRTAKQAMKIITMDEAERRLHDVGSVALGGMLLENRPSALVRALLRSGAAGLFLCSAPAASWDADILLGAGRGHGDTAKREQQARGRGHSQQIALDRPGEMPEQAHQQRGPDQHRDNDQARDKRDW